MLRHRGAGCRRGVGRSAGAASRRGAARGQDEPLLCAIAHELWRLRGGTASRNLADAQRLLRDAFLERAGAVDKRTWSPRDPS